jgi:hypothetical protein
MAKLNELTKKQIEEIKNALPSTSAARIVAIKNGDIGVEEDRHYKSDLGYASVVDAKVEAEAKAKAEEAEVEALYKEWLAKDEAKAKVEAEAKAKAEAEARVAACRAWSKKRKMYSKMFEKLRKEEVKKEREMKRAEARFQAELGELKARLSKSLSERVAETLERKERARRLRQVLTAVRCLKGILTNRQKASLLSKTSKASYVERTTPCLQVVVGSKHDYKTGEDKLYGFGAEIVRMNNENAIEAAGGYKGSPKKYPTLRGYKKDYLNNNLIEVVLEGDAAEREIDMVGLWNGDLYVGKYDSKTLVKVESRPVGNDRKRMFSLDEDTPNKPKFKGNLYVFFAYSSGGTKEKTFYGMKVTGDAVEREQQINNALNKLTEHGWELIKGTEGTMRSMVKLTSRICLPMTPAKTVFTWSPDCGRQLVMYMGTFTHENNEGIDGSGFQSAETMGEDMSFLYNTYISPKEAAYCWPQIRMAMIKALVATLPQHALEELVADLGKKYGIVYIENPTDQDVRDAKNGKYDGKILVIGKGKPFALFDRNCVKVVPNFTHEIDYRIVSVAKLSDCQTNVQTLQAMAFVPGAMEVIRKIAKAHIDAVIDRFTNTALSGHPVRMSEIETGYLGGFIPTMNPQFMFENASILRSAMKGLVNSLNNSINKLNFDLPGQYLKIMADMTGVFGTRILKDNWVYAPTLKEDERIDVNRCPKSETHDHAVMENKSLEQIKEEIYLNPVMSSTQKMIAYCFFESVPAGMVIVPWSQQFKNDTGGSDGDGDGVIIVCDEGLGKEWNDLAAQLPSGAAEIDGAEEKVEGDPVYPLNPKTMRKAYYYNINNENLNVGRVCNYVSMVISALQSKDNTALLVLQHTMNIGFGKEKYSSYITKPGQKLGCKELRELQRLGRNYRFETEDELRDFLRNDFLGAAPVMAGLVIDASKKYYNVTVLFWDTHNAAEVNLVHVLKQKMHKISLVTENGSDRVKLGSTLEYKFKKDKKGNDYETVLINCPLSDLKEELAKYAASRVREVLGMLHVSDEEKDAFFEIQTKYSEELAIMEGACKQYADFGALLVATENEDEIASIKQAINDIANNARRLTAHLSLAERGLVVRYASITKYGKISDTKHSSFMNAFAPEMIAYLLTRKDSVKICGEEIILHNGMENEIGNTVKFVHGRSKAGVSLDKPISGEFKIERFGTKTYATMAIEDLLNKENSRLHEKVDMTKVVFKVQGNALANMKNIDIDDDVVLSSNNRNVFVNKIDKAYGGIGIRTSYTGVTSFTENMPFATAHAYTMAKITGIEYVNVSFNTKKKETVAFVTATVTASIDKYIDDTGVLRHKDAKKAPAKKQELNVAKEVTSEASTEAMKKADDFRSFIKDVKEGKSHFNNASKQLTLSPMANIEAQMH